MEPMGCLCFSFLQCALSVRSIFLVVASLTEIETNGLLVLPRCGPIRCGFGLVCAHVLTLDSRGALADSRGALAVVMSQPCGRTGWLAGWLAGWLLTWLAGWLLTWLAGWLAAGWLAG